MSNKLKEQIVRVTKTFTFDLAHALFGYDGPCKNIHGHTYHLFVTIKGNIIGETNNPKDGMVLDFSDLKKVVKDNILDIFDHALVLNGNSRHLELNTLLKNQFEKIVFLEKQPTCENLLLHFRELLIPHFNHALTLEYLKLNETPTSYSEWFASDNK